MFLEILKKPRNISLKSLKIKRTQTKDVAEPAARICEIVETDVSARWNVVPVEVVPKVGKPDWILKNQKAFSLSYWKPENLDEDSVVFWAGYERPLPPKNQSVVLHRAPAIPSQLFAIWTNIFCHLTQLTFFPFRQIYILPRLNRKFSTCDSTSTVCSLEKYVLMLHIWTNAFCNLDKSVVLHWTPAIPHSTFCHVSNALSKFWWGSSWGDVAWLSKKYFFFTDHDWISQTVTFPNLSGRPFGTHRPVWGPWPEGLIQFD